MAVADVTVPPTRFWHRIAGNDESLSISRHESLNKSTLRLTLPKIIDAPSWYLVIMQTLPHKAGRDVDTNYVSSAGEVWVKV
ncbi:hypothetical protein [Pseudomonas huanghezhanensis]|uniref:hypothetical protein n=1 Tax=Pseudomonas huanghezhanensis TaxID=3002903 RepID=UPI002285567F|nr:hypothetical protein [Pseudomonas sp. BSw22131]